MGELLHYYYNYFMAPWTLSGTTRVSKYQKGKTNLDLLEQETVSGSGTSWAICKSALHPRQTTMPAFHHSVFYRPIQPVYGRSHTQNMTLNITYDLDFQINNIQTSLTKMSRNLGNFHEIKHFNLQYTTSVKKLPEMYIFQTIIHEVMILSSTSFIDVILI